MSAKLVTRGFLKIKLFQNKGYDVIISVHDVTNTMNQIISRESNYIVDVVITSIVEVELTRKTNFLRSALGSSSII